MRLVFVRVSTLLAGLALTGLADAGQVRLAEPEAVGMSSERLDRLTRHLEQLVELERAGGFQVLIARHGRVVMHAGIGMADIENARPVTEDTMFRIASMTKPVVGVAMMMLYEEGYFSLQDPISRHIPEFANLKVYAGMDESGQMILKDPVRPPTIHDLMQHTAGFTYGLFTDTPVDRLYNKAGVLAPGRSQQEFIDTLAALPLLSEPGAAWIYSVATDIEGYLIEKWTGMEAGEFLQQRIFGPLGMDETMTWVPRAKQELLAAIYTHDAAGKLSRAFGSVPLPGTTAPARFSGGGQLISTSDDYWRFCQMLLDGGELDGTRLLSPRSVEMMSHDRLDGTVTIPGWIFEQGFGLNFAVITDPSKVDYPASEGEYFWAGAVTTVFFIDPALDIVAILMTQYQPFQIGEYFDLLHRFVDSAVVAP